MVTVAPRLSMQGIAKRFGPTDALRGVDLELWPGEVHALIGENGAGKSTLMKVLCGAIPPDAGSISLDGQVFAPRGPLEARTRGIAMIYQEMTLAPHLSVADNMTLGWEPRRWGLLDRREQGRRVREALTTLNHPEIDPGCLVRNLSLAARQIVEIARSLLLDLRLLVLDEPTSSLAAPDVDRLFQRIRRLRDRGVAIVYISHFLEEVAAIADRFTVLRDGTSVFTGSRQEFQRDRVIALMMGRDLHDQFPRVVHTPGELLIDVEDLYGLCLPKGVNFQLRRGEIVGIAGLVGAGRTELLRAIYGLDAVRSGRVRLHVAGVEPGRGSVRDRIGQGVGLLSEDRAGEGLALSQSVCDNLTYSRLGDYGRLGWLNPKRRRQATRQWLQRLGVRCQDPDQPIRELSGGNQQKVAMGRLLHQRADLLLLDQPTRGVDIGSKAEIYRWIGELAAQGKAVLLVSNEIPELLGICDRMAVMARGRLSELRPVSDWTAEQVLEYAVQ